MPHAARRAQGSARAIAALNRALAQRTEDLEVAYESLRPFSSSASHDLRAPLSSIKGFHAMLKKTLDAPPNSRIKHYMARIDANTGRMEQLIAALLALARSTASELRVRSCDFSLMAREVLETLRSASPSTDAEVHIEPGMVAEARPMLLLSVVDTCWAMP